MTKCSNLNCIHSMLLLFLKIITHLSAWHDMRKDFQLLFLGEEEGGR